MSLCDSVWENLMLGSEMTNRNEYLISEPAGTADACVIWLHGLGADGNDFAGIVDQLGLPLDHRVRFIFPNAPFINITINNGMLMRGWYDIYDLSRLDNEDAPGIKKSYRLIEEYIKMQQAQGIDTDRIILAGFSQGGAIALYSCVQAFTSFAGILALSTYMPLIKDLEHAPKYPTPIYMAHGLFDPIVPYNLGLNTCNLLKDNGYNVEWHAYPMQHTLCQEEIIAIGKFICRCLNYD